MQRLEDDWSGRHKLVPSQKGVSMASTPFNRSPCLQRALYLCRAWTACAPISWEPCCLGQAFCACEGCRQGQSQSQSRFSCCRKEEDETSSALADGRVQAYLGAEGEVTEDDEECWRVFRLGSCRFLVTLGYANFKVYDFTFLKLELLDAVCVCV